MFYFGWRVKVVLCWLGWTPIPVNHPLKTLITAQLHWPLLEPRLILVECIYFKKSFVSVSTHFVPIFIHELGGKNDVPYIWNPKKVSQHLMHWEKLFVVGPFSSMYQMKQLLTAIFLKWTNISQHIRWIERKKALGSDSSYSTHFLSCFKLVNCIYAYFSTHFCWEKFFDEYKKINKKK